MVNHDGLPSWRAGSLTRAADTHGHMLQTGTTNRVDTCLNHSPAGALAHALQLQGCPAVIRPASGNALASRSGAWPKLAKATCSAPHQATGAREPSCVPGGSELPWVRRIYCWQGTEFRVPPIFAMPSCTKHEQRQRLDHVTLGKGRALVTTGSC